MLLGIKAYMEYNIKSLLKDKISLIWSISIPTITLITSFANIEQAMDLRFWWSYIIITSYLFGIGVFSLDLKETGVMRTIFSINDNKTVFFLGNLATQIIYSFICLVIFNLLATLMFSFNFIHLMINSVKLMFICIPIAFLGYNLTLLKNIHANTINTIANMLIFIFFLTANSSSQINHINPLVHLANMLIETNSIQQLIYVVYFVVSIAISIPSILNYSCLSNDRR